MTTPKRPDITPAQVLAALAWVVAQLVGFGLLDSKHSQDVMSYGSTVIFTGWIIGDALLRGLRNLGLLGGHRQPPEPPPVA